MSALGVHIRAKALILIEIVIHILIYYEMVNLKPSASLLRNDPIINNFKLKFDAIKARKKKEVSTPKISQKLDIVCWMEVFLDFLSRIFRARNISWAYAVSATSNLDYDETFELMNATCCTEDSGP